MLNLEEIRDHLETLNETPRLTLIDLDEAIRLYEIELSPRVLAEAKQALREPRKPHVLGPRLIKDIEADRLRPSRPLMQVDRIPEVRVFVWVLLNYARPTTPAEIGEETGLSESVTRSALAYLIQEKMIERDGAVYRPPRFLQVMPLLRPIAA